MKKLTIKTIAAIMLFSMASGAVLLNSCKKNVKDIYPYTPVVLAPDFQVVSVDYAFDNGTLNSASNLSFKVTYKNNEVTGTTYSSVLNFYIDGVFQKSVMLSNIASNTTYQTVFDWQAVAGSHDFKFVINQSTDGSMIVAETNIANNSQITSLDIPVKALVVAKTENVTPAVVTQSITADPTANVTAGLAQTGQVISTTVPAVKTTYTDGTTTIVAAVQNSDGTIDPTKVVVSATVNSGVNTGQEQQATISIIVESFVAQKEVVISNGDQKLDYKDGVISFVGLKSAKTFTPCSEPTNFELLKANTDAYNNLKKAIDGDILIDGLEKGLLSDAQRDLIATLIGYGYTQGNIDNPPTYTLEFFRADSKCEQFNHNNPCVNGFIVEDWGYPGFKVSFRDDRNSEVEDLQAPYGEGEQIPRISSDSRPSSCNEPGGYFGEYSYLDCGNNGVHIFFHPERITIVTDISCAGNVHNIGVTP